MIEAGQPPLPATALVTAALAAALSVGEMRGLKPSELKRRLWALGVAVRAAGATAAAAAAAVAARGREGGSRRVVAARGEAGRAAVTTVGASLATAGEGARAMGVASTATETMVSIVAANAERGGSKSGCGGG